MNKVQEMEAQFDRLKSGYKVLFILVGMIIVGCVLVLLYADMDAGYYGYGKMAETVIDSRGMGRALAYILAALPTLVQILFWISKVGDIKLADNEIFTYTTLAFTLFDWLMDTWSYYKGTMESIVMGLVMAVVVFTFFSEMMLSFLAPVLWAMITSTFSGVMDESKPDAVRAKGGIIDLLDRTAAANRAARQPIGRGTPAERMARIGGNGR